MKLLQDIKQCRTTFDTSDTRRSFGPIVVDYNKVQSKVSLKYDSWHKDVLSKFGQLLGQEMTQFHGQVRFCFYTNAKLDVLNMHNENIEMIIMNLLFVCLLY